MIKPYRNSYGILFSMPLLWLLCIPLCSTESNQATVELSGIGVAFVQIPHRIEIGNDADQTQLIELRVHTVPIRVVNDFLKIGAWTETAVLLNSPRITVWHGGHDKFEITLGSEPLTYHSLSENTNTRLRFNSKDMESFLQIVKECPSVPRTEFNKFLQIWRKNLDTERVISPDEILSVGQEITDGQSPSQQVPVPHYPIQTSATASSVGTAGTEPQ